MQYSDIYECKTLPKSQSRSAYVFEVKSLAMDGSFAGYASVFHVVDNQRDVISPGAFRVSLKEREQPVQLLWQHQWAEPIGVIESLFEDSRGLFIKGRLLMEVARAKEAYALLKAGVLKGLSIGYNVKRARRDADTGIRTLMEVDLWEVSLVTFPANEAAQVTVIKSADGEISRCLSALERAEEAMLRS